MQTELDDVTLARVVALVTEVGQAMDISVDQDRLLMLISLQLAYNLEKISQLLEPLEERLDKLAPWEPMSEESE